MDCRYKTILSIAGSDSIGGAGIQADIKTASALGVYAMTAITALTAQNTTRITLVEPVSAKMMQKQLEAIISDVVPDAIKIGMIPDGEIAGIIARFLKEIPDIPVVTDTVMVATTGVQLSDNHSVAILREKILPNSTLATPNIPEAEILSGIKITGKETMVDAGKRIIESTGCKAVLVKGGHLTVDNKKNTCDTFCSQSSQPNFIDHQLIDTENTHGTGCSLSSAIASYLALGKTLGDSVVKGIGWLLNAIENGKEMKFGHGKGPLNHIYHNITYR